MARLPNVTDPLFRQSLKTARIAAGFSYSELARRAGIHPVMPARYEDEGHSNATLPSLKTWEKLNSALFPSNPDMTPDAEKASDNGPLLRGAGIDEIVAELKRRGATSVTINW
ncbi:helix-turn-helix domain-containing protein [Paraburkholderia aspalathi]|uniref:helix-turn-helix domain-containing protein n=1 Tax=Paraburkholderia aspalathi TaxID=1324617 RepID=UPI003C9267E1